MRDSIVLPFIKIILSSLVVASLLIEITLADNEKKQNTTRKSQMLSTKSFNIINSAYEAMNSEKNENALKILSDFLSKNDRLKNFDKAKVYELQTYIFLNQGKYKEAISTAENAISLHSLDNDATLELHYRLIHLYSSIENYNKSIQHLELWFQQAENPDPQAFFIAAQIYTRINQFKKALEFAQNGMHKHQTDQNSNANENWYQLLLAINLELKEYKTAIPLLEIMIGFWPDKLQYFKQLSALYQEQGQNKDSLAILSIAYQNTLFSNDNDIKRLAHSYRFQNYPYKAATILEKSLQSKIIPANEKSWEQISRAWMQSREWDKASPALQHAAQLSSTGEHWFLLCQTAFQNEQWIQSTQHCLSAIKKGGLTNNEGSAWQLLALSRFHDNKLLEAVRAFDKCSQWETLSTNCTQWSQHIKRKMDIEKQEVERVKLDEEQGIKRQKQRQKQIEDALHL